MAFGISPKYVQDVPLNGLSTEQFLALAIEAAKNLNWNIGYKSEAGFIAYSKFSMSSWSEEISVKVEEGYAILKSECTGNQMFDWGKNKRNIEDLIATLNELQNLLTTEELTQKYEELKTGLVSREDDTLSKPPTATKGMLKSFLAIFIPTRDYFITPILINLNLLVFILMITSGVDFLSPDTASLLKWGANYRPLTLQAEWWRLITNFFLHIGIFHLLFNMYALLYIGLLLEPYLGKMRFLAAYMLTGIVASTTSLTYHAGTVSAGASGAIFGMYGVFLALLTTNIIEKSARKTLLTSIGVFVAYNLMNGMKAGIDNAAHLGGLLSGFCIGYLFYPGLKNPERMDFKLGSIIGIAIAVFLGCFLVVGKIPNDIAKYDEKMKSFAAMESMALELYSRPKNESRDSLLIEVKDRGLYYWNEDINLVHEVDKLDLPDIIHKRNKDLIRYCNLRIDAYNLIYKSIDENTAKYKDSIEMYNKQVKALVDSLSGK